MVDRSYKDNLKKTVILGLTQPGKTIEQIRQERKHGMPSGVAWDGDEEQEKYRDLPVWHYKGEIDDFVIKKLNVPDEVVNERFPSRDDFGPFYMEIVHDLSELRAEDSIVDWKEGSGIWRLTYSPESEKHYPSGETKYFKGKTTGRIMKEYDDEGCGETESGANDFNCAEFVCAMQEAYMIIYTLSMAFSSDSTTYCTYYDSTGMAMQELVNAGGCASYLTLTPGVAVTQAMVDEYTSNGCDWGDSTIVNSVIPGQGRLTKVNIKGSNELIKMEKLLDQIPDNYSSPMRKRINRILSDQF